jgi:hypothetical protein
MIALSTVSVFLLAGVLRRTTSAGTASEAGVLWRTTSGETSNGTASDVCDDRLSSSSRPGNNESNVGGEGMSCVCVSLGDTLTFPVVLNK